MPTVLLLERHPVQPDEIAAYEQLLTELVSEMRRQPGILWADAAKAFDDPPSFVVAGEWRTAADLDAWEDTDDHRIFSERSDPLVRETPTRRRFLSAR